jgi:hypothetical protein
MPRYYRKTKKKKNYSKLAKTIVQKLKKEGIEAYVWHNATHGSAYIRFQYSRIGSIRIADHKGRSHLSYRWNVRSDFPTGHSMWHKVNGRWRYYVHAGNWADMIPYIKTKKQEVETLGKAPIPYFIPEHKKNE